jgi:hypothetical protein
MRGCLKALRLVERSTSGIALLIGGTRYAEYWLRRDGTRGHRIARSASAMHGIIATMKLLVDLPGVSIAAKMAILSV